MIQNTPQARISKVDKGKQKEEEDFFAYYNPDTFTMKNYADKTHRLEEEITSILREPSVKPERFL
jgi:hypothetical protein